MPGNRWWGRMMVAGSLADARSLSLKLGFLAVSSLFTPFPETHDSTPVSPEWLRFGSWPFARHCRPSHLLEHRRSRKRSETNTHPCVSLVFRPIALHITSQLQL